MSKMMTLLALGAIAGSVSISAQAQQAPALVVFDGTRLDLAVTGESTRVPDVATVSAAVVTEAPTAQAALAENNTRMRRVFQALEQAGVEERDIQTSQISLNARYDYSEQSEPRLLGYTASNQLSVRFREIERSGRIIDALVAQGVNQINGPNLGVDEPEAALDEARRDAITKARQRAELYASAAGMRVVRIVAISESGAAQPPVVMQSRAVSNAYAEDSLRIAPGEQSLSINLSVTFELQ